MINQFKPSDLRIGNYYLKNDCLYEVNEYSDIKRFYKDDWQPIILNDIWINKIGFESDKMGSFFYSLKDNVWLHLSQVFTLEKKHLYWSLSIRDSLSDETKSCFLKQIYFVHDLQNVLTFFQVASKPIKENVL